MGILRADVISHSQLESTGGSIVLDGVGDYLTFAASGAFSPATSDVTFELWFYLTDESDFSGGSGNYYLFDMGSNGYRIQMYEGLIRFGIDGSTWTPPASGVSKTTWHHAAGVRQGNSLDLYLDGNHVGQKSTTASVTSTSLTIGNYGGAPYDGEPYGYISNFRFVKGVVYNGPFTPPKFELKNIAGTIVLGCQSSSSATDFAVTPSAITAQGNAAASSFHPDLKKDITDTGVVFTDNTKFDNLSYMVPAGGTTAESNRGRAVIGGGTDGSSDYMKTIDYFSIPSEGNGIDFGDLSYATRALGACSSSTRGLFAGGMGPASEVATNSISYITIATTANGSDFGDLSVAKRQMEGLSNQTRGIWPGGQNDTPASNTEINSIDYVTIATTGNAADFGDIQEAKEGTSTCASSTRGLIAGGDDGPAYKNTIGYITIATTGNATNFGDLSLARSSGTGCSNETRGLFFGGRAAPNNYNTIEYVTIASTGDSTDFGDLTAALNQTSSAASQIRGVLVGGNPNSSPYYINLIEYVNIASTGNSSDFGDTSLAIKTRGGTSDCHGGL